MTKSPTLQRILNASSLLVAIEAAVMIGFSALYVYELIIGQSKSLPAMISLTLIFILVAVWLTIVAFKLRDAIGWARSSALFWQTCQLAIAWESFTGPNPRPIIGIALIVPSVLVLALVLSKPVLSYAKSQN